MSPTTHHLSPAINATRSRAKREWYLSASLGVIAYAGLFAFMHWILNEPSTTLIITVLLVPIVVSIFMRPVMLANSAAVQAMISSEVQKPISYADSIALLAASSNPKAPSLASRFRQIQLYWAASSFYILIAILAIMLDFLTKA